MKNKFIIEIDTKEKDFCENDLKECIKDGMENVGNHTLRKLNIKMEK